MIMARSPGCGLIGCVETDVLPQRGLAFNHLSSQLPASKRTPGERAAGYAQILTDRAYIGEVRYQGRWHPGSHEPLVDRVTWGRVQTILGGSNYRSHEMTYASELIRCGFCGSPITGEAKTKK